MCGAPVRTVAAAQAFSKVVSEADGSGRAAEATIFEPSPRQLGGQASGKSIGIGIAVAMVLLVPLFLVIHSWPSKAIDPAAAVSSGQPKATSHEVAAPDRSTTRSAKKVHPSVPLEKQTETPVPAAADDAAQLWKGVRSGDARAEVTLAKLYLDGNTVPQSCEQTHMLLLAASKRGYKAADNLLTGAYAERCQTKVGSITAE
jgi:hypothetical protein